MPLLAASITRTPPAPTRAHRLIPSLAADLPPILLEEIVAGALRLLDTVGVLCSSSRIASRLLAVPGTRQDNERIYLSPTLAANTLTDYCQQAQAAAEVLPEDGALRLSGPWCCLARAAGAAGPVGPATTIEVVQAIRLLEGLDVRVGVAPLEAAADTPPAMRNLAGLRAVLKHSRGGATFTNLPTLAECAAVAAMGAAAGRRPNTFVVPLISPLKFECTILERILDLPPDPGFDLHLGAGMPAAGSTASLYWPAAWMQSLAETLAVTFLARALHLPGGAAPIRTDPFDLRYANYVVGSPEFALSDRTARALHRHLTGAAPVTGAFRTMAKLPDAQAQAERTSCLLLQALQGARRFSAVGQLSLDEVFSPVQAIYDVEIARHVLRIARGLNLPAAAASSTTHADDLAASVDCVAAGVATGHFLDAPETLAHYRDGLHHSTLFRYETLATWQQRGAEVVAAAAERRAAGLIAATPEIRLSPAAAKDLDQIYTRAETQL